MPPKGGRGSLKGSIRATILGGSWDLESKVIIGTLIGVISKHNYSYLVYNPNY